MNTKLLRQKILDFAIRGKLTDQRKSDGTARDLLTQISDERRKTRDERIGMLSKKSGVILSGARSAKSKDPEQIIPLDKSEVPFEIPENWEWVCVDSIASLITDGEHLTPRRVESFEGYYLLSARNIQDNAILLNDVDYVDEDEYNRIARRCNPRKNDVLISCSGSIGRIAIVKDDNKYVMVRSAAMIRPMLIHSYYLMYALQSNCLQNQIQNYSKQTAQANLFQASIRALQIPLPPIAEQQRIVAKIEEAFAEIDAVEKNKELLKTHIKQTRQKILDLAIHGKLVPQNKSDEPASVLLERITRDNPHYEKLRLDERRETKDERGFKDKCHSREGGNLLASISKDEIPFDIPENWVWCRLGDLSESIQYGYNAPAKDSGRIKMVRISDIHENDVEWNSVPYCDIEEQDVQTYLLKKNDILFARTGGTVGKSFIVGDLPEEAVYAGYLIRTRYGKNVNAQYMKFFMESDLYWEQLRDGCIATAQPNCNGKTLGKMKIPLPPLNEQSRIVAKIDELFSTLDQMERNLV